MKPEQRQRIIARHRDALRRHGHAPQALYWSSEQIQQLRFRILLEIGVQQGDRVLDVGCGFGDLYPLLCRTAANIHYTGLDLSPDLIAAARELHPAAEFFSGDLFDLDPTANSYDLVLLSGALNEALDDDGRYARAVIKRIYDTSRRGVACNLLNAENGWIASRRDLQSFHPAEIRNYCNHFSRHTLLRSDYLENDFTLYLFR
jgi:SAM-dependent methyltransferase